MLPDITLGVEEFSKYLDTTRHVGDCVSLCIATLGGNHFHTSIYTYTVILADVLHCS